MYRVSVIMSVYNEKVDWLHQAIESILVQGFKDFEFIIICDNPKYKEGINLLKSYSEKDNRIKLVFNEENIGLTKSLNKGIRCALGEYIVRMDADDYSYPTRLEKQVAFMDSHSKCVASGTAAYFWDGKKTRRVHRLEKYQSLRSMIVFESPIFHPSAIFRRIVDGNIILYNEEFKYSQDYALWISLIQNHQISNIDEPLIKYRISESQISSSKHEEQRGYAVLNQKNAINLLQLPFSQNECNILRDLTRTTENSPQNEEVQSFIKRFNDILIYRSDLNRKIILKYLLLLYANYLPQHFKIGFSIRNLIRMFVATNVFSIYSVLSLLTKYLRK